MKTSIITFVAAFLLCHVAKAQEWQLALAKPDEPATITVPANAIVEFAHGIGLPATNYVTTVSYGGRLSYQFDSLSFYTTNSRLVGPVTITQSVTGGEQACFAIGYRITNSTPVSTTPSNAVVIPSNATGNVQIILESSTDLINWVAANPGTYNSTTTNRFFRVRAVQP